MEAIGLALMMGGQPGGSPMVGLLPIVAMLGIMYFLLIRPQQKEARRHQEMLNALKKGDEVVTFGGLYGKIMGFSGDRVSLRVAENVKVEVDKAKILRLVERTAGASDRPEPAEKAEPAERSGKGAARAT